MPGPIVHSFVYKPYPTPEPSPTKRKQASTDRKQVVTEFQAKLEEAFLGKERMGKGVMMGLFILFPYKVDNLRTDLEIYILVAGWLNSDSKGIYQLLLDYINQHPEHRHELLKTAEAVASEAQCRYFEVD